MFYLWPKCDNVPIIVDTCSQRALGGRAKSTPQGSARRGGCCGVDFTGWVDGWRDSTANGVGFRFNFKSFISISISLWGECDVWWKREREREWRKMVFILATLITLLCLSLPPTGRACKLIYHCIGVMNCGGHNHRLTGIKREFNLLGMKN